MDGFNCLNKDIRNYIYDQKWPSLTKIQNASIVNIEQNDSNFILAAPTSSGKTEAAFLPALNAIDDWKSGVKIIYVSPLIALINDQFKRISELCEYLQISVTKWHGEASQTQKKHLIDNPKGILLITPESLEAMLSMHSERADKLFSGVEWILVDEIHGFLDNNRGVQLQSLLERMQRYTSKMPRYIGMSATLHEYDFMEAKKFFHNGKETKVLFDKTKNSLQISKNYYPVTSEEDSLKVIKHIYAYAKKESMLVFPNSRANVEFISVNLAKLVKEEKAHIKIFAHHSSVSKEVRKSAENFAKGGYGLFTICCTSTLELGIDIGAVDSVVQYNAPYSVSSLSQRLGRSGRRTKENNLHFIATNKWDLLQGLAAISLYEQGVIDYVCPIVKPHDVFAHQILSVLLEYNGLSVYDFEGLYRKYECWSSITEEEYKMLVHHLIEEKYIEKIDNEIITSVQTEKLLKGGMFFAHFKIEDDYAVISGHDRIGMLPLSPHIEISKNIYLASKVWKIIGIEYTSKVIRVEKAAEGKVPQFISNEGEVSHFIRCEMLQILLHNKEYVEQYELSDMVDKENPYFIHRDSKLVLRTFAGTRINITIKLLLEIANVDLKFSLDDSEATLICLDGEMDIKICIRNVLNINWTKELVNSYFRNKPQNVKLYINSLKFDELLPLELQIRYITENKLAIGESVRFLEDVLAN